MIRYQRRQHVVDDVEVSVGRGELLLHCRACDRRLTVRLEDEAFDRLVAAFLRRHPQSCGEAEESAVPQQLWR